ncbi:hypothetical protein EG329_008044 [Mollisiaceae sp. DMI_Dod_QoI]|nr:hypothetical protein EG329_008044 [Helotiales sp. DMI_Dod_QoI]
MKLTISTMGLLGIFALPMIFAASLPHGLSVRTNIDGMQIAKMTFSGTIGGHEVQLNGSVQEINAQMKQLHPDFDPDTTKTDSDHYCWPVAGQNWQRAQTSHIKEGISYLDGFKGLCGVPASTCVRISCSYNAGIYLCNDNNYGITPNCAYIASYAQDIINLCNYQDPSGIQYVSGQEFDTDGYNVCVHSDHC